MNDKFILVDHKPVLETNLDKWIEWKRDLVNRVVRVTNIGKRTVSTVFVGHNQGLQSELDKGLFETMVFTSYPIVFQDDDEYVERYDTWDEAVAGHEKMCNKVRGNA